MATEEDSTSTRIPSKTCTKCSETKPLGAFARRSRSKDGLCYRCRPCMAAVSKAWGQKNHARAAATSRRWYHANTAKARAMTDKYRAQNPERIRASERAYRTANAERVRAKNAKWWREHPDATTAYASIRRTRISNAGGRYSPADMQRHYEAQGGLCFYCAIPLNGKYHDEHMIPVSRGGTSWPENMCCSCARCNRRKGTLTAAEFLARIA